MITLLVEKLINCSRILLRSAVFILGQYRIADPTFQTRQTNIPMDQQYYSYGGDFLDHQREYLSDRRDTRLDRLENRFGPPSDYLDYRSGDRFGIDSRLDRMENRFERQSNRFDSRWDRRSDYIDSRRDRISDRLEYMYLYGRGQAFQSTQYGGQPGLNSRMNPINAGQGSLPNTRVDNLSNQMNGLHTRRIRPQFNRQANDQMNRIQSPNRPYDQMNRVQNLNRLSPNRMVDNRYNQRNGIGTINVGAPVDRQVYDQMNRVHSRRGPSSNRRADRVQSRHGPSLNRPVDIRNTQMNGIITRNVGPQVDSQIYDQMNRVQNHYGYHLM